MRRVKILLSRSLRACQWLRAVEGVDEAPNLLLFLLGQGEAQGRHQAVVDEKADGGEVLAGQLSPGEKTSFFGGKGYRLRPLGRHWR